MFSGMESKTIMRFLDVLDEAESSSLPIMVQSHTNGLPSSLADHIKGKSSKFILEGVFI